MITIEGNDDIFNHPYDRYAVLLSFNLATEGVLGHQIAPFPKIATIGNFGIFN